VPPKLYRTICPELYCLESKNIIILNYPIGELTIFPTGAIIRIVWLGSADDVGVCGGRPMPHKAIFLPGREYY
jgi:hypothetical protein